MKTNKEVLKKVEDTFATLDAIEEVKVCSSFQQGVFNKIQEHQQNQFQLTWFTPQLQMAAMLIILLVNTMAIVYTFSKQEYVSEIDNFAQEYYLKTTTTFTLN